MTHTELANSAKAIVLSTTGRYFYGFGKRNRVLTAWSLSGAKLFQLKHPEIEGICKRLKVLRKDYVIISVRSAT